MKNLMAAMIAVSLVSSMAFAQGTSNTKLRKKAPTTYNYDPDTLRTAIRSEYMVDGFNLGFEYVNINSRQFDVKSKVTGTVQKGLKEEGNPTGNQVGVKFGYKQIRRGGMGWDLNASLLKNTKRPEGTAEVNMFAPSANFVVSAPEYVYGSLGVNSMVLFGEAESNYSARLGYQVGGGLVLGKNFNMEVFYSWVNYGEETQYALMENRSTTTNARLIYAF
ncbi:hypothetical protein [Bdellovibrio sp. HCB337]|uniref:hypothetical protein n=1 Tax=Bdellovibrio sp. HCB337 TaxID=3394358 RepID=UPI0039A6E4E7